METLELLELRAQGLVGPDFRINMEEGSSTTTSQRSSGGKVIYAPTPNNFNGDKKKYKQWRTTVRKYIAAYKEDFRDISDEVSEGFRKKNLRRRMNFVLAYLKADNDEECTSSIWAENFCKQHEDENGIIQLGPDATMKGFWERLDASFDDSDEKKIVEVKLQRFFQGKRMFSEYVQEFEILCTRAGYRTIEEIGKEVLNQFLISLLERQVHRSMVDRIYDSDLDPPVTYKGYKECLQRIALNIERKKALEAGSNFNRTSPVQQQQGTTATRSGDSPHRPSGVTPGYGAPMDIDQKRSQDRNCYNCGKPGHIAKFCREPKKMTHICALLTDLKNGKEVKIDDLQKAMKEEDF
jgi:hypothetical protein